MSESLRLWIRSGQPWVWLNAGAVAVSLVMVGGLLLMIAVQGLGHFWPAPLVAMDYLQDDGNTVHLAGPVVESEQVASNRLRDAAADTVVTRYLLKTGNRDVAELDFRWVRGDRIQQQHYPRDLVALERREWGDFFGYLRAVREQGAIVAQGSAAWDALQPRMQRALALHQQMVAIEREDIGALNYRLERLRLQLRARELRGEDGGAEAARLEQERQLLQQRFAVLERSLRRISAELERDSIVMVSADGASHIIPLAKVVRAYRPNAMSLADKLGFYGTKLWEFVSDGPREANTEGGIFPAIFGTVLMVILMSIVVTPFGVVAAIYLHEYARQGPLTRLIRIAVNNLAGVPSIVYGVFGLGFFVYFLGGNIDRLFFQESLPAPTFGTPGILWASLTLALLTLPVVIVATEEGLARIPSSLREGSLALGATKAETLWRTVLPMASPAMMTGLILAVARAAGEVAPLMLVGVVKLAPSLPLDGDFPYLHLERKFMHLGFHIYDVGFQSPNVEAARPLVYATALLLVMVIILLNLVAIAIRNRLRAKYRTLEQ